MKQTAVEWLQEAFEHSILSKEQVMQVIGLFEQAKEMEKEQMKALYSMWIVDKKTMELYDFEQYYNESYNLK